MSATSKPTQRTGEAAILLEALRCAADKLRAHRDSGIELTAAESASLKEIVATIKPRGRERAAHYRMDRCLLALAYYKAERKRGALAIAAKRSVAKKLRIRGKSPTDTVDNMLKRARRHPRIMKAAKLARRDPRFKQTKHQ